jgi:glycosyltransferase involved in cell wall biosynthesis
VQSFLSSRNWQVFYTNQSLVAKLSAIFVGLGKRLFILYRVPTYDFVFIHRELTPLGPPFFEWLIAYVFRKKIIYDFDDSIWLTDKIDESKFEKLLRWRSKVTLICKWSYRVSCGNTYLAEYAKKFNPNVIVNPTTIDTNLKHNLLKEHINTSISNSSIVIGWTGSHSTLKYLNLVESVLKYLEKKYQQVQFLVIADSEPKLDLVRLDFIKWNKESEVEDLLKIDIGIMPLPEDDWTKGKCGFKALQYMSLGIPAVASPVGVNTEIIDNGENGFLCQSEEDWLQCLEKLISDAKLRKKTGIGGRKKIISNYSVASNSSTFLGLFS